MECDALSLVCAGPETPSSAHPPIGPDHGIPNPKRRCLNPTGKRPPTQCYIDGLVGVCMYVCTWAVCPACAVADCVSSVYSVRVRPVAPVVIGPKCRS